MPIIGKITDNTLTIGEGVEAKTYTKASVIGSVCFHIFQNEKERIDVECTEEEHDKYMLKDAGQPVKEGYTYIGSCKRQKFDTPDGTLGDSYFIEVDSKPITTEIIRTPRLELNKSICLE